MNATSLYVSASRLVFQTEGNQLNWSDFYRLIPYLRQSLSCSVCGNLLINPYTPSTAHCQHHVCLSCIGGRKNLKPSCLWCKDYNHYEANTQMRILLQCYKKLCEHILLTEPYQRMLSQAHVTRNGSAIIVNGNTGPPNSLVSFIEEGAHFKDDYKSNSGLTKSEYSILPCLYTVSPPIEVSASNHGQIMSTAQSNKGSVSTSISKPIMSLDDSQYSVMYSSGNKLTIKRKPAPLHSQMVTIQTKKLHQLKQRVQTILPKAPSLQPQPQIIHSVSQGIILPTVNSTASIMVSNQHQTLQYHHHQSNQNKIQTVSSFKQPVVTVMQPMRVQAKRKGCRCGNATPRPGKLTCCGQRCPCYADSKSCVDCKCRGCRNPHSFDGVKVSELRFNVNNVSNELLFCHQMRPIIRTINKDIDYNEEIIDLVSASSDQIHTPVAPLAASVPQQNHQITTTALTSMHNVESHKFVHHQSKQLQLPLQESLACQPLDGSEIQGTAFCDTSPQMFSFLASSFHQSC